MEPLLAACIEALGALQVQGHRLMLAAEELRSTESLSVGGTAQRQRRRELRRLLRQFRALRDAMESGPVTALKTALAADGFDLDSASDTA